MYGAIIEETLAEAFYGKIPNELIQFANQKLTQEMVELLNKFYERF
jgi:hypothetical protein